ncbi:hypothetical protein F4778DRAFT_721386 [Xylariomycetidae sp. FL2044]|nr:hypothetical protein F4778DRAFT_721386 [Xylariomycetidae sp. FL2044]
MPSSVGLDVDPPHLWKDDSIEERIFAAALICLEGHYMQSPVMGTQSLSKVMGIISKTLEKTHTVKDVREVLSKNLRIWIWLRRAISSALCDINEKSLGIRSEPLVQTRILEITAPEITALIIKNYMPLKEALQMLNKLMHIARNLLVITDPVVPQDLSAAINFDHEVYEAICLCVNITSKGIDGEMEDDASRLKLNEITELYKKVLVTSLQQAHNWISKNDRNKLIFWTKVFIESPDVESNPGPDDRHEPVFEYPAARCKALKEQIQNWLQWNSKMCTEASVICAQYFDAQMDFTKNPWLPYDKNMAWNYNPFASRTPRPDATDEIDGLESRWDEDESDKFEQEQDKKYGRVSHELDCWWAAVRCPRPGDCSMSMYPIEFVPDRIKECEANLMQRYAAAEQTEHSHDNLDNTNVDENGYRLDWQDHHHSNHPAGDYAPEYDEYEEEPDDDDSYGEGPMTGLLTEVANTLDPKQIEALHMIVKSCILDSLGSGEDRFGENLQRTRCRLMLATETGRNLLRELFVFIAVWEKDEQSLIFQISSQIVQAVHENALIPFTWNALRLPKDIMSPGQTVLLRLITYLSRTTFSPSKDYNPHPDPELDDPAPEMARDDVRLGKMVNFLYSFFRSRLVPECVALMQIQGEVRKNRLDPADFPVDTWDLERAKDGLVQFLDFLYTMADSPPLRQHLIDYEAVYELLKILEGLDIGVERAPFAGTRRADIGGGAAPTTPSTTTSTPQASSSANPPPPPPPPPPPITDQPHLFAWSGVKGQVLSILAALLQPPPGQTSPGNPAVQLQIVQHNGIVALLNCCLYDDNNRFCRERTQLCLKWLMDGSPDASAFLQNLVSANSNNNTHSNNNNNNATGSGSSAGNGPQPPPTMTRTGEHTVRIDGVPGEVRVQVRSSSAPDVGGSSSAAGGVSAEGVLVRDAATKNRGLTTAANDDDRQLIDNIMTLTVEEQEGQVYYDNDVDDEEEDDDDDDDDGDETEEDEFM